jgi:peptidoglycan/LPS O-acetylase OafA/YrhL
MHQGYLVKCFFLLAILACVAAVNSSVSGRTCFLTLNFFCFGFLNIAGANIIFMQSVSTTEATPSTKKEYFANLDALRVIAFGMVFCLHSRLGETLGILSTHSIYRRVLGLITDGGLGVSFFFVLSGFLITYLLLGEVQRTGRIHLGNFYMRRSLRIWPLYFAVVIFGFFIYPWLKSLIGIHTEIANQLIYQLTFLSNFDLLYMAHHALEGKSVAMLNITWSVAIEEQFYLIWPLLFILTPSRYYQYIFYTTIVVSLVFRYMHDGDTAYFHTLSVSSDLAMGGLAAWHVRNSPLFVNSLQRMPQGLIIMVYIMGGLALLYRDNLYSTEAFPVWARLVHSIFFAFVVLEQSFALKSPFKFSSFRYLSRLGKYTYGLYLLHPIAIQFSDLVLRALHISIESLFGGLLYAGIALGIALVMSFVSYRYFEAYFINLKHRFA